jgi:hypothetical protein
MAITDEPTTENRKRRRAAKAKLRRAKLIGLAAELVEGDKTVSGITIIPPGGRVDFLDADLLRGGGGRA